MKFVPLYFMQEAISKLSRYSSLPKLVKLSSDWSTEAEVRTSRPANTLEIVSASNGLFYKIRVSTSSFPPVYLNICEWNIERDDLTKVEFTTSKEDVREGNDGWKKLNRNDTETLFKIFHKIRFEISEVCVREASYKAHNGTVNYILQKIRYVQKVNIIGSSLSRNLVLPKPSTEFHFHGKFQDFLETYTLEFVKRKSFAKLHLKTFRVDRSQRNYLNVKEKEDHFFESLLGIIAARVKYEGISIDLQLDPEIGKTATKLGLASKGGSTFPSIFSVDMKR